MNPNLKRIRRLFISLAIMLFASIPALAQTDTTPKKKLRNGVAVNSEIGGESHDSYFIRASKGQTITVTITGRVKKDGNFNLTVSRSANFFNSEPVKYGRETSGRKQLVWTGKARASGNYYFYTTAFPTTRYTIRVTIR